MNLPKLAALLFLAALLTTSNARAGDTHPDYVLADFEGKDYGDWKTTGTAFGPGPAQGTLPDQMHVTGYQGHGLVNSYYGGDKSTGTLTSPPFAINRRYVAFLIGGGGFEGKTCINLLVDGKVVRTATGPNTKPGGSEALAPHGWEVGEFAGRQAVIEIVDGATGGWGHINVDQIVLTDHAPAITLRDAKRQLVLERKLLNLPVKTGGTMRRVGVEVDGKIVREFDIELADSEPDFWVPLDVTAWRGKTATIHVDTLPNTSVGLQSIDQGDAINGVDALYREALRPQFHFSPRRGWTNDPNGLVFYAGQYHLFFQHNPYGWSWGNMHWGHATSPDLVHWTELPIAICPRQYGDWVFSGSAVVDADNTSGFKAPGAKGDVLVAAFTSTARGECIAYSNDAGLTWAEFAGNPVVKHAGRDPRLLWYAPGKHWVMAVYDETGGKQGIAFYTSPDLKAWKYESKTEGFFECPDLFELPVDGDANARQWVLTAASSDYMIGTFDGKTFTPQTPQVPGQRGNGMYAAQTYSNIPAADGRRIQIGWGRMPSPGMPFNQMMCFPCELTLRKTADGVRMCWWPVREIEALHGKSREWKNLQLKPGDNPLADVTADLLDVTAEFEITDATAAVGFRIRGMEVRYDAKARQLVCGESKAALRAEGGRVKLRVLVDRTSLEIFPNGGEVYMPMVLAAKSGAKAAEIFATASTLARRLEVDEMRSSWAGGMR